MLAEGRVLLGEPIEIGRLAPPEAALVGSCPPRRSPRSEVVGAFPAVLDAEDRAELLQAPVERAHPLRPAPLVDIERVAEAVVVLVDLAGCLGRIGGVPVHAAEAPGAIPAHVELGIAGGHPLGDRLADPTGAAEAVQGETGGHPEARHAGHRAEQRIPIRRHRIRVADERDHAGAVEEREAPYGAVHELGEALLIRRDRSGGVIPRNAVGPTGRRIGLVAAKEDPARLRLSVDEVVRVPEAGHLARELVAGHGRERDVLVVDGNGGREATDHRRELRCPHPASVHDVLGLDRARLRLDRPDVAPRAEIEPSHAPAGLDPDVELSGRVR